MLATGFMWWRIMDPAVAGQIAPKTSCCRTEGSELASH
jgi:hypothetical protein